MGEIIVPVIMLIIGAVFYRESGFLRIKEGYPMTSASYPKVLSVILMLCAVILIVRFIIKHRKYISAEKNMIFDLRIFLALGAIVLFYFGLNIVGYIVSGIAFLAALSLLLQKGKPRVFDSVILPVILATGLYYVFKLMNIYLPVGSVFKGFF